jgi:CHAT domain-containing protein
LSGVRTLDETTRAALATYRASLAGDGAPIDPASLEGLALSSLLPAQVLARALSASSLVIAPHGFFHLLPWPMLLCGEGRLFTMRPSSVVPSLTWLAQVPPSAVGARAIALIGDPAYPQRGLRRLDLADDELHEIADIYGPEAVVGGKVIEGEAATEAAFRALAERPDARGAALHVVCHGDFVAEEPLYSGLLLADGKVDASEIARLPFRDREVVLSSCSSGVGASSGVPLTGDDIVGLVGAFLEAGASSVTVSITRARDDASHAFMTTYHRQRKAGSSPVRALQATQKAMIADTTYEPALWSGFVVFGG